jgi:DNA polymerase-3 subunit delta
VCAQSLSSVYLFTGQEAGEKKTAIEEIKKALKKKAGNVDEYTFYASETSVADIVLLLQNESLFASARFALVHNAELIKNKEDIEPLKTWITESSASAGSLSVLVLESAENKIDKKLENLVPEENCRIFYEMFDNKKEEWLRNFFAKAGYRVENDAIDTILGMIENNTEALAAECSRYFLCYTKDHAITSDDAESLLMHNREESAFTLFDALADFSAPPVARLENALAIMQKIRGTKDGAPQKIIPGLAWCFRKIADWRALHTEHPNPSPLDYKIAGFSARRAQTQYGNASRIWNERQTVDCLALIADAEAQTRFTGGDAQDALLETMLYALVIKNGTPLEQAVFAV